jgi:hypothetical protein
MQTRKSSITRVSSGSVGFTGFQEVTEKLADNKDGGLIVILK